MALRLRLEGDESRASAYVQFAKNKLAYLKQRIRLFPGHVQNQQIYADDGTVIHLQAGMIDSITIKAPLGEGTLVSCNPSQLSTQAVFNIPTFAYPYSGIPSSCLFGFSETTKIVESILGKPYPVKECWATHSARIMFDPAWLVKTNPNKPKSAIKNVFTNRFPKSLQTESTEICAPYQIVNGVGSIDKNFPDIEQFFTDRPATSWSGSRCGIGMHVLKRSRTAFAIWKGNLYMVSADDLEANYALRDFRYSTETYNPHTGLNNAYPPSPDDELCNAISAAAGVDGAVALDIFVYTNLFVNSFDKDSRGRTLNSLNFLTEIKPNDV